MAMSDNPGYRAPTRADEARATSAGLVLDNHRIERDGSMWLCVHCKATWPWPRPLPMPAVPCVPRRWGDQ
jgi:hypothetical protein